MISKSLAGAGAAGEFVREFASSGCGESTLFMPERRLDHNFEGIKNPPGKSRKPAAYWTLCMELSVTGGMPIPSEELVSIIAKGGKFNGFEAGAV